MSPEQRAVAEQALAEALTGEHAVRKIAEKTGITTQAVHNWTVVPPIRALAVSEITGVPCHRLRPDLYRDPASLRGATRGQDTVRPEDRP